MASRLIKTSLSHRAYTLAKFAFPIFGYIFFFIFFSSDFWFDNDLSCYGILIILFVLICAHALLCSLESAIVCRFLAPLYRGKPPVCYLNWLEIEVPEEGDSSDDLYLRSGLKRVRLSLVDELDLSLWGNLIFKSRALCGSIVLEKPRFFSLVPLPANPADVVLKAPASAISTEQLRELVEVLRAAQPKLLMNERLQKKLASKTVRGEDYVTACGALMLLYVLFDCGYSLCLYLEMLKHYYLAQVEARRILVPGDHIDFSKRGDMSWRLSSNVPRPGFKKIEAAQERALKHLQRADEIKQRSQPLSIVSHLLLERGLFLGTAHQARAEALWYMGCRNEAIALLEQCIKEYPARLKWHYKIELVRWLIAQNKEQEARALLLDVIDEHEDGLMPRLYLLSILEQSGHKVRGDQTFEIFCKQFDLNVFGEEPRWPTGNISYLTDYWSRDDVHFLLPYLLGKQAGNQDGKQ